MQFEGVSAGICHSFSLHRCLKCKAFSRIFVKWGLLRFFESFSAGHVIEEIWWLPGYKVFDRVPDFQVFLKIQIEIQVFEFLF